MTTVILKSPRVLTACLMLATNVATADSLKPLNDTALSQVTGREGIRLNMEFLVNASLDSNGDLVPEVCPDTGVSAAADCRFGIQFNSVDNAWLVVKDYYGMFRFNGFRLDGTRTQTTASGLCDTDCQQRFGVGFDPDDRPAILLGYDHAAIGIDDVFYDDADIYLHAGKVVAEFDQLSGGSVLEEGFLRDNTPGAAIGLLVADGPNGSAGPAMMRFDGNVMVYGY